MAAVPPEKPSWPPSVGTVTSAVGREVSKWTSRPLSLGTYPVEPSDPRRTARTSPSPLVGPDADCAQSNCHVSVAPICVAAPTVVHVGEPAASTWMSTPAIETPPPEPDSTTKWYALAVPSDLSETYVPGPAESAAPGPSSVPVSATAAADDGASGTAAMLRHPGRASTRRAPRPP